MKDLLSEIDVVEHYNTNNAWGFGGAVGKIYHYTPDIKLCLLKACYRHGPGHRFIRIVHNGKKIFEKTDTTLNRKKAVEIIKSLE